MAPLSPDSIAEGNLQVVSVNMGWLVQPAQGYIAGNQLALF